MRLKPKGTFYRDVVFVSPKYYLIHFQELKQCHIQKDFILINEPNMGGYISLISRGQSEYRGSCHSPGVYLSSSIEEYLDDVDVTPRSSKAKRRVVGNIAVFLIGSPKQQQLNHLTDTSDSYTAWLKPGKC